MLYYLSRCNRYSNTPSGVTDYLQLTKGTVSQSLKILEIKGLLEKREDPHDKRQIHLSLTADGHALVEQLPPDLVFAVSEALGETAAAETVAMLQRLLVTAQGLNGMKGFGVCRTCSYHQTLDQQYFRCALTGETLAEREADLICREHVAHEPSLSV
jgi:DNA-binding MarR family transcriptional regulator